MAGVRGADGSAHATFRWNLWMEFAPESTKGHALICPMLPRHETKLKTPINLKHETLREQVVLKRKTCRP